MNNIEKIMKKKEFSELPKEDVKKAFHKFEKRQTSDEEKIKLTRNLLREVFSGFTSEKLLSPKNKDYDWILRKHLSTRERYGKFREIYLRILRGLPNKISVIDLGAGVNGFSFEFFKKGGYNVNYIAIEAMGQLDKLMNSYFKKNNIKGKALHMSLFDLQAVKNLISETDKPRVIFLLKVLDSLEMLEKNYSKKLLKEIAPLCDRFVVSFATESMHKREKFRAKRRWLTDFVEKNFKILDDFIERGEKFLVFEKK